MQLLKKSMMKTTKSESFEIIIKHYDQKIKIKAPADINIHRFEDMLISACLASGWSRQQLATIFIDLESKLGNND